MTPAAVVTGISVAAPNGFGTEEYWQATLAGRSGLGRLTRFDPASYPSRIAGEIEGFVPENHIPSRLLPQTDHLTRLTLVTAERALFDASVQAAHQTEYSMGVVTAASGGSVEFGQRELQNLWAKGREHVSAYQSFAWFYAVNSGQISIRHRMRGPGSVLVTEHAGGLDVFGHARRLVRKGTALVVTGSVDGSLCPWGWVPQMTSGMLSTAEDPSRCYQPFAAGAAGYVPGEGGAILIVEEARAARDRGAPRIYGEIRGYAATFDPPPGSGRPPGLRRAAEQALADAEATPGDIDVVFADAAAVPALDRAEAEVLAGLFGARGVPVTAPKTMTGRLAAGAGCLDVAAALLSIRDGIIPPTVNVPEPAFPIDLVTSRRRQPVRTALILARGHCGFNAALVVAGPRKGGEDGW
jgi:act minimal PKS chain-length factor (CLF/KS beta)